MVFDDLKGKVVVVTGASRRIGIGAAICRAFATQGANVFFTGFRAYDAAQAHESDDDDVFVLLRELRDAGVEAEFLEVDLSLPDAADTVLSAVNERFGGVDVLVNNATCSLRDGFEALNAEGLDAHYVVNMRSAFLLATNFAKQFSRGSGGRIIFLSSGQGVGPMPDELAYVATKGAVEAFVRTLAVEVAHKGITVNAVDPGATDTGWMTPEFKAELVRGMRMGRVGEPEDAARLIVFLASDAAKWITGQVVHSRGA